MFITATAPSPRVISKAEYPAVTGIKSASRYQQRFFDELMEPVRKNLLVDAVAGSGKTSTIVGGAKLLIESGRTGLLFVAYNRHIVRELETRLPKTVKVQTSSSLGYETLRRSFPRQKFVVVEFKYGEAWRKALDTPQFLHGDFLGIKFDGNAAYRFWVKDKSARRQFRDRLFRLRELAVVTTTPATPEGLAELATEHGIFCPPDEFADVSLFANLLNEYGENEALNGRIDYTDMLWLPNVWNLNPPQYSEVISDEWQDFNALQLDLVKKLVARGARGVSVGDPFQSIYGWNGATPNAFGKFEEISNGATRLPLSICYRCPRAVISLAQSIVPHLEAAPNAPEGVVADRTPEDLAREAVPGDLVLSRLNAPLLKTCFKFLAARKPAFVRGSDVARMLAESIRRVAELPGFQFRDFPNFASEYGARLLGMTSPDDERGQAAIVDLVASMRECWKYYPSRSVEDLCDSIKSLFGENIERNAICLSTVHKAKGLEANRVWIIDPDNLPRVHRRQSRNQYAEELRIRYVALTRAKRELYFVREPKDDPEAEG